MVASKAGGGSDNGADILAAGLWSLALGVRVEATDVPILIRLHREARRIAGARRSHHRDPAGVQSVLAQLRSLGLPVPEIGAAEIIQRLCTLAAAHDVDAGAVVRADLPSAGTGEAR